MNIYHLLSLYFFSLFILISFTIKKNNLLMYLFMNNLLMK